MSLPFFNHVIAALGKRINYDAISNYAGNSFAKDSWKMIQEANPLTKQKRISSGFMDMLNKIPVKHSANDADIPDWAK